MGVVVWGKLTVSPTLMEFVQLCVDTKEFRAVQEYCSQVIGVVCAVFKRYRSHLHCVYIRRNRF